MGNLLQQNPIIVDTVSATPLLTHPLRVTKIRWDAVGHATDDHVASIQDRRSVQKWKETLTSLGTIGELVASVESDFSPPLFLDGLIVDVLGGGVLYIYVDNNPPFKTT